MDLSVILNPESDIEASSRRVGLPGTLDAVTDAQSSSRGASSDGAQGVPTQETHTQEEEGPIEGVPNQEVQALAAPTQGSRLPASLAQELRFIATLKYRGRHLTWRQITDCYSDRFGKSKIGTYVLRDLLRKIDRPGWRLDDILRYDNGTMPPEIQSKIECTLKQYGSGLPSSKTSKVGRPKPTAEEMRFVTALRFCAKDKNPSWSWITKCFAIQFKTSISSSDLLHRWYTYRGKDDGLYKYLADHGGQIPPRFEDEVRGHLMAHEDRPFPERSRTDESPGPTSYKEMFRLSGEMNRFITVLHHCVKDMEWKGYLQCFNIKFKKELERFTPGRRPAVPTLRQYWELNREVHGSFYRELKQHNTIQPEYEEEVDEILAKYGKDPAKTFRPHVLGQSLTRQ